MEQRWPMRDPDLEIDLLRAFVAVVESGSFTAAAGSVGRSQSAVSQKVLRLEEIVGRRVFQRTSRSLSLTRDGERLLTAARRLLEVNDALLRELREPEARGTLRLGVADDFIPSQLPQLLARFSRIYPEVHLELMTGMSCQLLAAYDAGQLDAVIAKKDGAAQRGRVIWREPLVWLAAADYPDQPAAPVRLVLLPPPCTYRELMISALDGVRRDWQVVCTASNLMGVQAAVAGGLGVTVLGRSFALPQMQQLATPGRWPALPMSEIIVLGEDGPAAALTRPLVTFLGDSLAGRESLALAAG